MTLPANIANIANWTERVQFRLINEHPERLEATAATASFVPVIGGSLQVGRWFTPDEERAEHPRVAVLSDRLWRIRFHSNPNVLGRPLILNGTPHTVIGVAAAEFSVPSEPDLWVPQIGDPSPARRANRYLQVIGRLRPGFTRQQAQEEIASIARQLAQEFPDANRDYGITLVPLLDTLIPREVRAALAVLFGAAVLVLLIACANVANVLLSRATARRQEIAIRSALGAGASRITRQLLTESVLLASAGALAGLLVSIGIVTAAKRTLGDIVPRVQDVDVDVSVVAFTLALTALTTIVFGLAPLWRIGRARRSGDFFHPTGRDNQGPLQTRARGVLIGSQVCLTTLLLVCAALLVQSLVRLQNVSVGITAESVVTAKLSLVRSRLPNGSAIGKFLADLTSALEGVPGIESAGISSAIPLSPGAHTITRFATDTESFLICQWRLVDTGDFRTFRIPLLRGRLFEPQDLGDSPKVFVISQQTARDLYGTEDAVGRRLRLENGGAGEVVGVVADVRMRALNESPERVVYFPPSQFGFFPLFNVIVRTGGAFASTEAAIRDRLKQLDPNLAAYEIQPMQHWVDRNAALMRLRTWLVASLGAMALLLGVIGIYGTTAYLVTQRAGEFGIRIALGARPAMMPLVVVRQGLRWTFAGIACGVLGAVAVASRTRMSDLLFQVDARDPVTLTMVAAIVAVVAASATYLPARRIARTDPVLVLRAE